MTAAARTSAAIAEPQAQAELDALLAGLPEGGPLEPELLELIDALALAQVRREDRAGQAAMPRGGQA